MHTLGERESGKPDREFESRPLRHVREKARVGQPTERSNRSASAS